MSRTLRNPSPANLLFEKNRKVRDGADTHVSESCRNHGSCPWCSGNRKHKIEKSIPVE